MRKTTHRLLPAAALLAALTAHAQETYTTIESFSSAVIDPQRWTSFERERVVKDGALVLRMREYGPGSADTGRMGLSHGEDFTRPSQVTRVRASLTPLTAAVEGCAANPWTSRVRARLLGTFFSTGRPTPGSYVGDLMAQVSLVRDSDTTDAPGLLRVEANAFVCTSYDCSTSTLVGTPQSLGTVPIGTTTTLRMDWDKANRRIVFGRDALPAVAVPYGALDDTLQPGRPLQTVALRTDLEYCTAARTLGDITVRVDNVAIGTTGQ